MNTGRLSHEQARQFRNQGYYRLPGVFTSAQTAALRDFVIRQAEATQPIDTTKNKNLKLYGLYDRDHKVMDQVVKHPGIVETLQSLVGPNVVFVKNRHNHATLNSKQGVPAEGLHRDILQPTRGLVTVAIYLQDSTIENGATKIIPGSHELPYVGVPQADGGGTWMSEHDEYAGLEEQAMSVTMPEGGVLFFNGLCFHGVGHNQSGGSRMSMTLGYRSVDELSAEPDTSREILVAGDYIYRGNDR